MTEINSLNPAVTAADYLIAALGMDGAKLALWALRADWLLDREAKQLEPLAAALAYLLNEECPKHCGKKVTTRVVTATPTEIGAAVVAHVRKEDA